MSGGSIVAVSGITGLPSGDGNFMQRRGNYSLAVGKSSDPLMGRLDFTLDRVLLAQKLISGPLPEGAHRRILRIGNLACR